MRRLLLLPVLALVGVMFVATPANAATVTSFTANGATGELTVTEGTPVSLAWTVETTGDPAGAVTVTAAGSSAGAVDGWSGTVTSPTSLDLAPGIYEFAITATEVDVEGSDTSAPITVTVEEATAPPTIIAVPTVTFPEPCTVAIPATENVTFGVNYGQSGSQVQPGTYDFLDFVDGGIPVAIVAVPDEGFAFPEGADNSFEFVGVEDCFGEIVEAGLVETRAICKGVVFTNITDEELFVAYGGVDSDRPDDDFELAAGESRTIDTDRDLVVYISGGEDLDVLQVNEVEVEQDCSRVAATHPTVAPAAGSDSGSTAGLGALAALTLAGGAALGVRRLRRTA